jgi:tRNA nucleotidyltransferase/poly(A) polymerase
MAELTPFEPYRPLLWSDFVYDLQDFLLEQGIPPVYIVGGGVRDALLGAPQKDLDLTTGGDSIAVARKIANHFGGDVYVMDSERGVGRVLLPGQADEGPLVLDVSRFRADDLLGDLQDRDFTINAMAVDLMGDLRLLIDPMNGTRDLQDKILCRCSPASIAMDPLRGLRAVRQSVQLGFHLDAETRQDIEAALPAFAEVSAERVRDEFIKLLALPAARRALKVADVIGLLGVILPETNVLHGKTLIHPSGLDAWRYTMATVENLGYIISAFTGRRDLDTPSAFGFGSMVMQLDQFRQQLRAHITQHWADQRPHQALLSLAALVHKIGAEAVDHEQTAANIVVQLAGKLRLSNDEKDRLLTIIRYQREPLLLSGNLTPVNIYRYWRRTGEAGVDICLLALAGYLAEVGSYLDRDSWLSVLEGIRRLLEAYYLQYEVLVSPPVLLDGNDLMQALDLKPGPQLGELLESIREAQVTGEVTTREEALAFVQSRLAG